VTGRIPDKKKFHVTELGKELSVIALIPNGFCGFACGKLHGTGIETSESNFYGSVYLPYEQDKKINQVLIYELGRNFWYFSDQLGGDVEATPDTIDDIGFTTAYAIFMRWYILDKLNLSDDIIDAQLSEHEEIRELFVAYLADSSLNWENTVLQGKSPVTDFNSDGNKQSDFLASLFYYLHDQLGDQFVDNFWREIKTYPYTYAGDNRTLEEYFFKAASESVGRNLTEDFVTWKLALPEGANSYEVDSYSNISYAYTSGDWTRFGVENTSSFGANFDYSLIVWTENIFPDGSNGIDYFWENNASTAKSFTKSGYLAPGETATQYFSLNDTCNHFFTKGISGGEMQLLAKANVTGNESTKRYQLVNEGKINCPLRSLVNINLLDSSFDSESGWIYMSWLPMLGISNYSVQITARNITSNANATFAYNTSGRSDLGDFVYAYEHEVGMCNAFGSGEFALTEVAIWPVGDYSARGNINVSGALSCQ